MWAVTFSNVGVFNIILTTVVEGVVLWAIVDIASRPRTAFNVSRFSKRAWLIVLVLLAVVARDIGAVCALFYWSATQPKIRSAVVSSEPRQWRLAVGLLAPLVIVVIVAVPVFEHLGSTTSTQPIVAVDGYLAGHCTGAGEPPDGLRVDVTLSLKGSTAHQFEALGGITGDQTVSFEATPGTWTLTATSGTVARHWGLVYSNSRPLPQAVPYPTAMNVAIPVDCAPGA